MSTKVKITHCAPIIANIYGRRYSFFTREGRDVWIEVKTPDEVRLIDIIEYHQEWTYKYVQQLTALVNSNL